MFESIRKIKTNYFYIGWFIIFAVLAYIFPYTHDDWAWGSEIGLERMMSLFENYNGRWLGNLLVILMTRFRFFRAFFISFVVVIILFFINKVTNTKNKYFAFIMFALMPISIFSQAVAWTSGFTNYVVPIIFVLILMMINSNLFKNQTVKENNKLIIPLFFCGFCCQLFIEHMTIYNLILAVFIVVYSILRNKKVTYFNLAYLVGTIIGTILMFSNGAYYLVATANDSYRSINTNILFSSIKTFFYTVCVYFIQENTIINLILSSLILFLINNYKKINTCKRIKNFLNICEIFICSFLVLFVFKNIAGNINLFSKEVYNRIFDGIIYSLFIIVLFVIVMITVDNQEKKAKLVFYLVSSVVIALPLLVVNPIGPRCFFPCYIFWILYIVELLDYVPINYNKINKYFGYSSILLIIFFIIIYGQAFKVDQERIKYVNANIKEKDLILPRVPYEEYMQCPNPVNEEFLKRFRLFYGIDKDVNIDFIEYDLWEKIK